MSTNKLLRFLGHQKWIRFGIRDRIIRYFTLNSDRENTDFEVPFYNKIYSGNFNNYIDWCTYYYGAYCPEELQLMKDSIVGIEDPTIFDIGANVGHHTLFASTIASIIYSFEPYPPVAKKLKEKILKNDIKNVKIFEVGLGDSDSNLPFLEPTQDNTGRGTFIDASDKLPSLPIRNGDKFLKENNISSVDFMKIDIEGFEPFALRGLTQTIAANRPIVFFEWSSNERNLAIDQNKLFPENYDIFDFDSDRPFLIIFCHQRYILRKPPIEMRDGNKLAVPREKLKLFANRISNS